MSYRPKGKYVSIDSQSPRAIGICDYTGLRFNHSDLVRQLEWRGRRLAWTGFYVGRPFVDTPNAQLKPPVLVPDPVPIQNPRPPQYFGETWIQMTSPVWRYQGTVWYQWGAPEQDQAALAWPERQQLSEEIHWVTS